MRREEIKTVRNRVESSEEKENARGNTKFKKDMGGGQNM